MGDKSAIEWTDASWNPVTGCSKVSPGCAHCYAETVALRFWPTQYSPVPIAIGQDGEMSASRARRFTDVMCHEDRLEQPLRWKRSRRVFVNSMSDLFHEDVPDDFIDRVFAVMALASQHTFQVLTKRAERMRDYLLTLTGSVERMDDLEYASVDIGDSTCAAGALEDRGWPLPNVWLGVSVENQHFADERIPLLLQTPAAVRLISAEPLLGPMEMRSWLQPTEAMRTIVPGGIPFTFLDWVIVGGESGPKARPMDLAWARSIVQQCQAAGVPVFVKQLGAKHFDSGPVNTMRPLNIHDHRPLDRKGGDPSEWPDDLRVRQFPRVEVRA